MTGNEIAHGASAFYLDSDEHVHYVSRKTGELHVRAKDWVEISKEEAISLPMAHHKETVGLTEL